MSLFRSREEIPKLPKAPSLLDMPPLDDKRGIIPELPAFPSKNEIHERFNQQMVKSAVSETPREEEVNHFPEVPYGIPSMEDVESHEEHHEFRERRSVAKPQKETVYVKIEKFNNAQKAILDIQLKVRELSKAIDELKHVKAKEMEELNGWDKEMKNINLRLSGIDKGIFGEV